MQSVSINYLEIICQLIQCIYKSFFVDHQGKRKKEVVAQSQDKVFQRRIPRCREFLLYDT